MIGISVKAKYALAAMIELAVHFKGGHVQLKTIAERHGIPQAFLEQLMMDLKKANLIKSYRGAQGGYSLSRSPSTISAHEILESIEGPFDLTEGHKGCCSLNPFWNEVSQKIKAIFSITLTDIMTHQQINEKVVMFSI